MLAGPGDGKAFLIEQPLDVQNVFDVFTAIHALPGGALHRLQLRKLRLPKSQNVSRQMAEPGNLADAEIKFVGDQHVAGLSFGRGFVAGAHQHFRNGACHGRRLNSHTRVFTTTRPAEQPKFFSNRTFEATSCVDRTTKNPSEGASPERLQNFCSRETSPLAINVSFSFSLPFSLLA